MGAATAFTLLVSGKIAGISGVFGRILRRVPGDTSWRAWFVLGLIGAGAVSCLIHPDVTPFVSNRPIWVMGVAGLLVGVGTRVGGGCTSGHGICGVSQAKVDSITATMTFMGAGAVVVFLVTRLGVFS